LHTENEHFLPDSAQKKTIGKIHILTNNELFCPTHTMQTMDHFLHIPDAISVGNHLGFFMPKHISAVVVLVDDTGLVFKEKLSSKIKKAIPDAVEILIKLVRIWKIE